MLSWLVAAEKLAKRVGLGIIGGYMVSTYPVSGMVSDIWKMGV